MRKFENFTHTNCKGETIDFVSLGIYINENDLRNFDWDYTTKNNKIVKFKRGVKEKKLPLKFRLDENEADNIKDTFFEHFEKDVVSLQEGYFEINGYRLYGYVFKADISDYSRYNDMLTLELGIVTDKPYWMKEVPNSFTSDTSSGTGFLNFPYNFAYNYTDITSNRYLDNDSYASSDFRLVMYGPSDDNYNPVISIKDDSGEIKEYGLTSAIEAGSYVTIDSVSQTIIKTLANGSTVNVFSQRTKDENYIFEQISSGRNEVSWDGNLKFDMILIDSRSTPRWKTST